MLRCRLVLIVMLWLAAVFGAAAQVLPAGASPAAATAGTSIEPGMDAALDDGAVAPVADPERSDFFDSGGLRADESRPLPARAPGCQPSQACARPAQPPWPERLWRPPSAAASPTAC